MTAILIFSLLAVSPAHAQDHSKEWHLQELDANAAWHHSTGQGVTVAVIDSGIDASHPDLADALLPGRNFIPDHAPDNTTAEAHAIGHTDPNGHGTSISGLIAANSPNDGPGGIAPGASILPVRVLDADNRYHDSTVVAEAITWAVDSEADIINLSLGSPQTNEAIDEALDYAHEHDVLVIACTGNRADHLDSDQVWFPARHATTIAVTGTDSHGHRMPGALSGPETALAAPADQLPAALPGNGWGHVSGTSFATALVSGTAALLRSAHPAAPAHDIAQLLLQSADGADEDLGAGIINPVQALQSPVGASGQENLALQVPDQNQPASLWAWAGSAMFALAALLGAWAIETRKRQRV